MSANIASPVMTVFRPGGETSVFAPGRRSGDSRRPFGRRMRPPESIGIPTGRTHHSIPIRTRVPGPLAAEAEKGARHCRRYRRSARGAGLGCGATAAQCAAPGRGLGLQDNSKRQAKQNKARYLPAKSLPVLSLYRRYQSLEAIARIVADRR